MRTNAKFTASSVVNDILCGRLTGMSASRTRMSAIVKSLGIAKVVVGARAARRESARIEQREIHRRLAVHDPVCDVAAGGWRMLKAMAAEADREEEARHARRPPDDRVIVGREWAQPG